MTYWTAYYQNTHWLLHPQKDYSMIKIAFLENREIIVDTPNLPEPESANILVVDDEGAIRYSISKTLQRVGYQVSAAASGEEALEMLAEQNFDVVLTDIRMPGLTGVELLAKIKEKAPDSIVILMTG